MRRLFNALPVQSNHYGRDSFTAGFARLGYMQVHKLPNPDAGDAVVMWNRYGTNESLAQKFERAGAPVFIIENGYFGKSWRGSQWYSISRNQHSTFRPGSRSTPERWAGWQVDLLPWHRPGGETVILGQRGIGAIGVKSPTDWARTCQRVLGRGRIRAHPGKNAATATPLVEDLHHASEVFTWASSAALVAIRLGVPIFHGYAKWVGLEASRPIAQHALGPITNDAARLHMFERLAWCMWTRAEVESGEALQVLLEEKVAQ